MDYLAPPLKACLEIRLHLENGISVSQAIKLYCKRHEMEEFPKWISQFLYAKESGKDFDESIS